MLLLLSTLSPGLSVVLLWWVLLPAAPILPVVFPPLPKPPPSPGLGPVLFKPPEGLSGVLMEEGTLVVDVLKEDVGSGSVGHAQVVGKVGVGVGMWFAGAGHDLVWLPIK